jgi:uncharacterized protein YbaP (TraB family)
MKKLRTVPCRLLTPLLAAFLLPTAGFAGNALWRASSERGTLYVQGSVHLLKAGDYPLDPAIEEAYARSDTLVFETDMTAMLSPETQQLIMQKALLPGTRTLEDELDPEVYARLSAKFSEAGLPIAAVRKFKPWFATMTLMVLRMQALGLDPALGLDQHFHTKALADRKNEIGLETVAFQISLFDELSEGNQNGYIKHALKELEQMETMLEEMLRAWKAGDLDTLDKLMRESFQDYPGMYKRFVTDRNKTWLDKIDKTVSTDHTCMVVVGTAHLAGEEGLLELLKARGYAIEQL